MSSPQPHALTVVAWHIIGGEMGSEALLSVEPTPAPNWHITPLVALSDVQREIEAAYQRGRTEALASLSREQHHEGSWDLVNGSCECECSRCYVNDECHCPDCTDECHEHGKLTRPSASSGEGSAQ